MRGWSIPLGRWFGVELRVHTFFLLLAVVCLGLSTSEGWIRGIGLFFVLVIAVVVREIARLLVAAWLGLRLRAILVLPIGGLFAYANPESQENANQGIGQFAIAFAGPLASCATAAALGITLLGAGGDIRLFDQPWISPAYLLRSLVWMQAGLGALHLFYRINLAAWRAKSAEARAHARLRQVGV